MEALFTLENLTAFITLTILEIVLGIDNVIFIAVIVGALPVALQKRAQLIGLGLAMGTRVLLLCVISWLMLLTEPVFLRFSGRDLILLGGGIFLIWKTTHEIHKSIEKASEDEHAVKKHASFGSVLIQIVLVDIVFSLDSVITAIGIADHINVMIAAIIISVFIMMAFSGAIVRFISVHPTFKMLALSFLILVGVLLVSEAFGKHVERGYVYFAMAFSFIVELLNTKVRTNKEKGKGG